MYQCEACPKSYKRSASLWNHRSSQHSQEKHTCEVCDATFSRLEYLRQHENTYVGPSRYVCADGGKRFVHQSSIARHSAKHSEEKCTCDTCNKTFDRREYLTRQTETQCEQIAFRSLPTHSVTDQREYFHAVLSILAAKRLHHTPRRCAFPASAEKTSVSRGRPSVCMIWGQPRIGTSLPGKYKMYISRECKRKLRQCYMPIYTYPNQGLSKVS